MRSWSVFYNFAGEGVRAAHARAIPSILEVNAPLKDHDGSLKALLDRLLIFRPMERLREEQCRKASAIVTPLESILPDDVPREKIHRVFLGSQCGSVSSQCGAGSLRSARRAGGDLFG